MRLLHLWNFKYFHRCFSCCKQLIQKLMNGEKDEFSQLFPKFHIIIINFYARFASAHIEKWRADMDFSGTNTVFALRRSVIPLEW